MDVALVAADRGGFFTRGDARAAGCADRDITRLVRTGRWHRIRRGAYAVGTTWNALDEVGRHRVRSAAVLHSLGDAVALSHVSAAVAHGFDAWGADLDRVHVTRLDGGAGRVEGDVVHHEGFCVDGDVCRAGELRATAPERCALETASRMSGEAALCLIDAGLHRGLIDDVQLLVTAQLMAHWPFMRRVMLPIALADGRSESVGESRGRWLFHAAGLPTPQLQYAVRCADGSLAGICDWAWPQLGLLGEFDGRVKYGRLLAPGAEPGDAVFAEKVREDELRELTGFRMVRLVWDDYARPRQTVERLRRALGVAA